METSSICGLKMKSVPPPHECVVDSFASELKQGERAHAAGLVLVVGWSWGSDPSTMYESMAADMRKIDPVSLHVYEAQYLHCTIATLSSFKSARSIFYHAASADRDRVIKTWVLALERAFERIAGLRAFELVFRSIESSPAATFLGADDPSGAIEPLRTAVKEAARDPEIEELSAELERKYGHVPNLLSLEEAIHVPDIIHSTVMRHADGPSDAQGLASGLAEVKANWKPATVTVREISLANEGHPYMHISRAKGEVHRFSLP